MMAAMMTVTGSNAVSMPIMASEAADSKEELSAIQKNAVSMLNYITVLTQEINASKNSKLYMEEAYSALINNTYPNAVDDWTLSQLTDLLDIMEEYRMVNVKRERLDYIYSQNQAKAIRAAIPNPLGLLSAVTSFRLKDIVASVVYMAVDSITSYTAYTNENDLQYLKDGWQLDDEAATILHNSRKGVFSYMMKMVGDYDIPGDYTLTEATVDELVKWKNNDNVIGRIQFLESNQKTYQKYGGYWLLLAESYYSNADYSKCLDAIETYLSMGVRIFRKDYDLARVLMMGIAAAEEELDGEEYIDLVLRYVQVILDNSDHEDWELRYFVAQTYTSLCAKTGEPSYLQKAYDITLDNVNYLVGKQEELNTKYLAKVETIAVPKKDGEEKKQIEAYNKMLKEERKTELPPLYEPLLLNMELLFGLKDQIDISSKEEAKIDGIIHKNGAPIFLNTELEKRYWCNQQEMIDNPGASMLGLYVANQGELWECGFDGTDLLVPAVLVTTDSELIVSVKEVGSDTIMAVKDWTVKSVERKTEGDVSTFNVTYTSKRIKEAKWKPGASIIIEIVPKSGIETDSFWASYEVVTNKPDWYNHLAVWEKDVKFVRTR